MCVRSTDHGDVVAPLLTVVIGLGVAGVLVASSVSPPVAAVYGIFASSLTLLAVLVGTIGWAIYEATREDGTRTRRVGRSGAA